MKNLIYFGSFALAISISACSGPKQQAENTQEEQATTKDCSYSYNEGSLSVKWIAYKTTEKIGVSGGFDSLTVNGLKNGNSMSEVFSKADFAIPVSSINTNNPDRDKKILEHFFGSMMETSSLSGRVVAINDNECGVAINMNGTSDTCKFEVNKTDSTISLIGNIELADWNALESVNALNEVCFDLHKGADGESKLWPDVKLEITAGITTNCD